MSPPAVAAAPVVAAEETEGYGGKALEVEAARK